MADQDQGQDDAEALASVGFMSSMEQLAQPPMTLREVLNYFFFHSPAALAAMETELMPTHLTFTLPRNPLEVHVPVALIRAHLDEIKAAIASEPHQAPAGTTIQ